MSLENQNKYETHRIPWDTKENQTNLKILIMNQENNQNHRIPCENNENHENHIIILKNQ